MLVKLFPLFAVVMHGNTDFLKLHKKGKHQVKHDLSLY